MTDQVGQPEGWATANGWCAWTGDRTKRCTKAAEEWRAGKKYCFGHCAKLVQAAPSALVCAAFIVIYIGGRWAAHGA